MSYQVLARKWRPYQFKDVVGQSHVLQALANALEHNRVHHAYLLSGTRGVGKTTIARIFAKGLNCEQGISASPCGQCSACLEIEQGRSVDLLEIDAASRTKVEDTRELLDNVQYKPARSRYKIYLIDEVHMLSKHSFNALLKTLEEPPEYVKFILATTDPQKLPITILSRCLQFHLKALQPEQIKTQLLQILTAEQITAEDRALSLLAHAADGSMRDALSLTDQAIVLGNGEINDTDVSRMLGSISTDQALQLIEALSENNAVVLFQTLAELAKLGLDWDALLKELASQFHRIALAQVLEQSIEACELDSHRLAALAAKLLPQDVQLYYQIALQGREDLNLASNARAGIEMVLLRMLAFKPAKIAPMPIGSVGSAALSSAKPSSQSQAKSFPTELAPIESKEQVATPQKAQNDEPAALIEPPAAPMNALIAARNQLRARKQQQQQAEQKSDVPSSLSAPSSTAINRLSSNFARSEVEKKISDVQEKPAEISLEQDYRWQATAVVAQEQVPIVTPKHIKTDISHERSAQMRQKLEQEAIALDDWSKTVANLSSSQMVKQLALNAAMEQNQTAITLFLRKTQAHLATEKNQDELQRALSGIFNQNIQLTIKIDDDRGVTPFEWRDKLYVQKLEQAVQNLHADSNIDFICQRFAATLDKDSIRPI